MKRREIQKDIREKLLNIGLEEMQNRVAIAFYNMGAVVETLFRAIVANKNVILYGPGGFGKTTIVEEFMKQADITYSTIIGYEDMDVEGLLGIPNVTKLLEESTYEIAFDKTVFVNPGILVLEEFLDVNPKTAIALKDIVTSGGLRQGTSFTESKIASIIICSNKSPYEMSTDTSSTAFYIERFPIVLKVDWEKYSTKEYLNFIEKVATTKEFSINLPVFKVLAELAYRTSKLKNIVSPRIVKDAVEFLRYNDYNVDTLKYIDGLDSSIIFEIQNVIKLNNEAARVINSISNINGRLEELMSKTTTSTRDILDTTLEIKAIIANLKTYKVSNVSNVTLIQEAIKKCEDTFTIFWDRLNSINIDVDYLFEL